MNYKGYRILATSMFNHFYETNEAGDLLDEVKGIDYDSLTDPVAYSVIDVSDYVVQTFDTIEEAKEYIDEEEE